MVTYRQRVREIERRLGRQRLIYFGTRGTDALPLLELSNFEEIFSQIAPLGSVSLLPETCLELLKQERVDLDQYSIDKDNSPEVSKFRRALLHALRKPSVILPYRPSAVLASAYFTRSNVSRYLGVFHEKQACFEHKPWVETELQRIGVPVLPWSYFADEDHALIHEAAETGPIVLRANRSDGGAGLTLVKNPTQIQSEWPIHPDGFLAAAPFLHPSIPLNVNACVFEDGTVSIHQASLQLIGITQCTSHPFGYCGNDFAALGMLDSSALEDLEEITSMVGRWLRIEGYLGAFGIDALFHDGTIYLVEVNPRFQGSSAMAATLMREVGRPDLYLDHISAFLGLIPAKPLKLRDLLSAQPCLAHLVCHNTGSSALYRNASPEPAISLNHRLLASPNICIKPGAIIVQAIFDHSITNTGYEIIPESQAALNEIISIHSPGRSGATFSKPRPDYC